MIGRLVCSMDGIVRPEEALPMASSRTDVLNYLASRRDERRRPVADGEEYVPISVRQRGDGRLIPVVKDEIVVPASGVGELSSVLGDAEDRTDDEVDHDCQRFLFPGSQDARGRVADERVEPTYLGVVGGTIKNRPTAEGADTAPQPMTGDVPDDAPLVIVVDTGVAAAAVGWADANRGDAWLGRISVDRDARTNLDLLDVLTPAGLDLGAGHGTFVAGIIGQITPARIVMVRAFDTDGIGTDRAIAHAIRRAARIFRGHGERGVLNLSFGIETLDDGTEPDVLRRALTALPPQVVVVAAAGNEPSGTSFWPATSDRALAVAALGTDYRPTDWTNHGSWVNFSTRGVDLVAPYVTGTETMGTGANGDPFDPDPETFAGPNPFATWEGTSFAAAQVTGAVANLLIADPTLTREEVTHRLQDQAIGAPIPDHGHPLSIL
jgi:subtilisin family serine protease